jgi:CRP-like cAMP-binding protein
MLCPSIANDIQVELLKSTIAQISLFDGCSDQFIVAMTSLLEMIAVPAHTTLFSVGDFGDAMYVVQSGVLAIVVRSVTVREIRKGSCFGELSVFSSMPRTATVISTTYAILYKLSRFHCERVLEGYPQCADVIAAHVDDVLQQLNECEKDAPPAAASSSVGVLENSDLRRVSVAAGCVAGASALVKVLSRRGKGSKTSSRRSLVPWRKGSVNPVQQNPSMPRSKRELSAKSIPRSKREGSGRISVPSSVPDTCTETGAELLSSTTNEDACILSATANGTQVSRRKTLNPYDRHQAPRHTRVYNHDGLWRLVLLRRCIDHQSRVRLWWLLLLFANLWYCWIMIPTQIFFPLWQQPSWVTQTVDMVSNVSLLLDIVLKMNLSFMVDSEKIMDPKRSAQRYFEGSFLFDLMCALPFECLYSAKYGLMRLPRLLRVFHLRKHLNEIEHFINLNTRRQLMLLGVLLFMMFHVVACIHFGISYIEGFNPGEEEAWISSASLCLRRLNGTHLENCEGVIFDEKADRSALLAITALEYARSLYYAVGVLASPGKSVEPTSDVQLVAALLLMLSGFLITAIVVDNVQKRFTASAFEQKEFFATSTRIQLFLRRQKAPLSIYHRVKSFLDYWWSSHRGAVISELIADLPRSIRLELLRSICAPVLQTLALLQGSRLVWSKLEEVMVENAKFILYGQGEIVYRHGDYVSGMFFLLEGQVCVVKMGGSPREIPQGSFFGTAVLTQQERSEGYTEHVSASSGCILLFVSREQLQAMEAIFPTLKSELLTLELRLLSNKLAKMHMDTHKDLNAKRRSTSNLVHSALTGLRDSITGVHDPDSLFILAWETWVFIVMTVQWVQVMVMACFRHETSDALMVFLELSFVLDMYIRLRLGLYEYGNKMMDLQRIKRAYLKSGTFALDIAALLPLFVVNWCVPAHQRWDMLNINKLLRLFKVPRQLHALETRYLKRTTELRLFKLLYYTFMLSHILGCIWFNFASKEAVPNLFNSSLVTKKTAFGGNHWLPHEHLEHGSHILQYMASLYWSFGLMSASSEPEFPKTTAQCIFSVVTMTTGFFLFAYVIGNLTDIIELTTSETREFNAKMGAVRQMLDHFRMPEVLQERVKTFFLFKRFHTITQEHILVHCLPPSLLTDIRLVHLKPMIEKVEFLRGMEGSITRMLVSQFTQELVSRGEFVCKFGERGSDMFFIFTGVLNVLLPSRAVTRTKPTLRAVVDTLVGKKDGGVGGSSGAPDPKKSSVAPSAFLRDQLKKVNEISAGSYFGENGLFTNAQRNAHIQAQTSCILYRLSRESLETVFERYPEWKQKVLRIASIHREQARLVQLSREEQRRRTTTASGMMLSRADILNERAERLKGKLYSSGLQRSGSVRISRIQTYSRNGVEWLRRCVGEPTFKMLDGLVHGVAVQSTFHLIWLRYMVCSTMYVCVMTPYQLAMDPMDRATIVTSIVKAIGLQCEVAFIVDIWFSWHVQESSAAMELYDQDLRSVYKKERMLLDVVAAIPFYGFLSVFDCSPWVKLLRCLKIFNITSYLNELNRRSVASEAARFWHVWMLYLLVIYWAACAYLAVAMKVGFGTEWNAWLPSTELEILDPENPSSAQLARRFLRGLFFATTTFVKKARNLAPDTASLYAFQISVSFTGLITMSFVIGELATLFISHIGLEVDFRKNHIAVELYLARQHVSELLKQRAYAFMTSLWSSHAGVNYEQLLSDMPHAIRSACVLHASKEPLDWFVMKVITPICWDGDEGVEAFTLSLAEKLRFESYPRDESVVTEGSIVRAMYFVVKGHLKMQSRSVLDRPVGLRDGSYFGERGLLGCTISVYTVRTVRACDLLSLSSEAFSQVLQKHAFSRLALKVCSDAYTHLKARRLAFCSRNDMEDHWGAALVHVVREVNNQAAGCATGSSIQPATLPSPTEADSAPTNKAASLQSFIKRVVKGNSSVVEGAADVASSSVETNEQALRVREMLETLDTSASCFEAFAPLLHIVLASDPMDWDASFSTSANTLPTFSLTAQHHNVNSQRYHSALPTIDASFNANDELTDAPRERSQEEHQQELNGIAEADTEAEKQPEQREAESASIAGPTTEDVTSATRGL